MSLIIKKRYERPIELRILLTGANGFVGKNIAKVLSSGDTDLLTPPSVELNLQNKDAVHDYLAASRPDLVIHAAGRVGGIEANIQNPASFLVENTQIGFNLLTSAKSVGVARVLNLGSSCMYPKNAINPLQEASLLSGDLEPTNEGYALAKISVAKLGLYLSDHEFHCKTMIPSNLYGPHDHFDEETGHLIPSLIARLSKAQRAGMSEITLWGSGLVRREFMYISDLVDAILFCIENFEQLPGYFNCGLGRDYMIREYYEMLMGLLGYEAKLVPDLSKPEGMKQKLIDSSVLNSMGWSAKTPLEAGLRETLEFYRGLEGV